MWTGVASARARAAADFQLAVGRRASVSELVLPRLERRLRLKQGPVDGQPRGDRGSGSALLLDRDAAATRLPQPSRMLASQRMISDLSALLRPVAASFSQQRAETVARRVHAELRPAIEPVCSSRMCQPDASPSNVTRLLRQPGLPKRHRVLGI